MAPVYCSTLLLGMSVSPTVWSRLHLSLRGPQEYSEFHGVEGKAVSSVQKNSSLTGTKELLSMSILMVFLHLRLYTHMLPNHSASCPIVCARDWTVLSLSSSQGEPRGPGWQHLEMGLRDNRHRCVQEYETLLIGRDQNSHTSWNLI